MAVTKIIPIRSTIDKSVEYICNPSKTEECKYIHSENCFPQTAGIEFEIYLQKARAGGNTIGRHLIQSFAPRETTPEQAHEIGKKLAAEILGGQYAYVMSTHVDRDHIHNHFVWCAVNIETHTKYRSNKTTYHKIQEVSDRLCAENSLSVITEKSGRRGKGYTEYQAEQQGMSWKAKLREVIDDHIVSSADYNDFLQRMQDTGYEIKHDKYISFRAPGQERFTRGKTIGDDYVEERIKERLQSKKDAKYAPNRDSNFIRQVIDIESNEKIKSSPGYLQWTKVQNLKISSQTLIYLEEHGMKNIDEFNQRYEKSIEKFSAANNVLSATDARIKILEELQKQLRIYGQTKDNYKIYNAAKDKDKFLRENSSAESNLMIHAAAKKHFDDYVKKYGKPLPSMKTVVEEITSLKASRKQQYMEYSAAKTERDNMLKLAVNLQSLLGKDAVKDHNKELII